MKDENQSNLRNLKACRVHWEKFNTIKVEKPEWSTDWFYWLNKEKEYPFPISKSRIHISNQKFVSLPWSKSSLN